MKNAAVDLKCQRFSDLFCSCELCKDANWYAVRTYSYRERVVADSFKSKQIIHYLPLLHEKRRWSDRIKTILVPVFKNYLFIRINPTHDNIWQVINTRGVTQILGNANGPIPIPSEEILAVVRTIESKASIEIKDGFEIGQLVRVKAGPLQGIEGHFVRMEGKDKLAIHVNLLGQTVLAEINYCDVETR